VADSYRIIVTGSRSWTATERIAFELGHAIGSLGAQPEDVTVVHGAALSGADAIAERIARSMGCVTERHPADWNAPCDARCKPGHRKRRANGSDFCPAQGMYRNQEMVDAGADITLAFIDRCESRGCEGKGPHWSHGSTQCASLASSAGIETRRFSDGR